MNRVDNFHLSQVWESPRGNLYKVIGVTKGGQATLRQYVTKRIIRRDWDAVINWVLRGDPDFKNHE